MAFKFSSHFHITCLLLLCLHTLLLKVECSTKLYIVYLGEKKHEDPNHVTNSHHDMLTTLLGSKEEARGSIIYSYKHGFSGFAAMLTEDQAKQLAELPEVISVKPSRKYKMSTTRSWDFLGLDYTHPPELLTKSNYGEDVIIGVVDSGVWPESKSFSDEGYGPIPSRWKGVCQLGEAWGANNCSRKIIGARFYTAGVDPQNLKMDYLSPRDKKGHGTHTASTAAGSLVVEASFNDLAIGWARGGAPRARLAIYKATWGTGHGLGAGNSATVLAAIDDAIHDGVDVLSLSLIEDEDSFGALHAVEKGITVVYAGGNTGPQPKSIRNTAPWVITVAASTIDRSFPTVITLGNNQNLVGQSIYHESKNQSSGSNFKELVYGDICTADALNGTDITGKVVLCISDALVAPPESFFSIAASNVRNGGGAGLIFAQYTTNLLVSTENCGAMPCVLVDLDIASQIESYLITESSPTVMIKPTTITIGEEVLAPKVAAFSSRGPSVYFPTVIKPDIAAPGVNILAAFRNSYIFGSGTSMATPHVSGVVALLKSLHPDWSPAAIKSALVTTASTTDKYGMPILAEGLPRKIADPFDYGGGHINPERAADPGLIYDIDAKDYYKFYNCTIKQFEICSSPLIPAYFLNLPSISIPNLKNTPIEVWRAITNVGQEDAVYKAMISDPAGVKLELDPNVLVFDATKRVHSFKVTFVPKHKVQGDYTFGSLTWYDGDKHTVRIPIAVRIIVQEFYADTE
ncbi:subtilisin-like protease SBT3.7 [Ananas comosus]|uniref:Subtilisin-like protease SBT3.7 n=2 Tax=Ananas comosus TaxID=4615 RepID=A0A6P5FHM0_ANACO|nr:subtilisin-like protease SBT3.7 [Ananas comosus]